ncbi:hypothetical protein PsYK624_089330 [Phanerochaete sordida]|uniref:F-box domain-containing protein n=1 Tax=Phanerochaete sordida TaxID=48140 RepID=A0A9P3GDH4_9APHY|nr:hypothetical protein PsYK624_089330 [Phanerochaete sordida]
MENRLPPELLEYIFSFLPTQHARGGDSHEDKTDLRSCLLVSRRWRDVALKPLYENISLPLVYLSHRATATDSWFIVLRQNESKIDYRTPRGFCSFLAENPAIASWIRSLTFRCGRYSISRDRPAAILHLPDFLDILSRLPALEALTLRGVAVDEAPEARLAALAPVLLKHLTIDWAVPLAHREDAGYRLDMSAETSALLRCTRVLHTLTLERYAGSAPAPACAAATRHLRRLLLRDCRTPPALLGVLFGGDAPHRALHVAEDPQSPLREGVQPLLAALGPALATFGWQLLVCPPTRGAMLPKGKCPRPRRAPRPEPPLTRAPTGVLLRPDVSACCNLEALALAVVADTEAAAVDALAAVLARAAQGCPRLRAVDVVLEFVAIGREQAPEAAARGAVEDALLALRRVTGQTVLDVVFARKKGEQRALWAREDASRTLREWFPRLVGCGMVSCGGVPVS